jgi:AcrR family transcriptional regulator
MSETTEPAAAPFVGNSLKNRELLEERRRQLVEAATKVFAERGFGGASVNEIAELCNWSVGALYRYINSKEDILFLVSEEIFRQIGPAALDVPSAGSASERLHHALATFCDNIGAHRRQVLLMYREYGNLSPAARAYFQEQEAAVVRVFRQIVDDGVASGEFVCEDPELFGVQCVITAHMLALKAWALRSRSDAEVRDRLVTWALRSLRP